MQHQERPAHGKAYARAIRTTTIAVMSIGLLTGSAVGVAAQDEETRLPELLPQPREIFRSTSSELPSSAAVDYSGRVFDLAPETPIYYTWENGQWPESETVPGTFDEETGALTGVSAGSIPVTTSDPRFNSTAWVTVNGQQQEGVDGFAIVETRSYRVVDSLGCTWTGTSTAVTFGIPPEPPVYDSEAAMLTGDGPCEGLTMWTTGDYLEDPYGEAVIFSAPVPPVPDAPDVAIALAD